MSTIYFHVSNVNLHLIIILSINTIIRYKARKQSKWPEITNNFRLCFIVHWLPTVLQYFISQWNVCVTSMVEYTSIWNPITHQHFCNFFPSKQKLRIIAKIWICVLNVKYKKKKYGTMLFLSNQKQFRCSFSVLRFIICSIK